MKHAAQPHRLFALLLCAALLLSGCSQGLGSAQNARDGVPDAAGPVGRGWGDLAGETKER